jgi:hypothetical protein
MTECPTVEGRWIGRWNRSYLADGTLLGEQSPSDSLRAPSQHIVSTLQCHGQ